MTALKTACTQKPPVGKILGLDGTLFSANHVNATTVSTAPTVVPTGGAKSGLTTGAYAGIGVAGAFVVAIFIAACIIGQRKKDKVQKERDDMASHIDNRFGNQSHVGAGDGGYNDHYRMKHQDHQSVSMVNVSSRGEKGLGLSSHEPQQQEQYVPTPQYHRPNSTLSQHTINPRGHAAPVPYAPYQPSRNESPAPLYSPAGSTQTSDSPSQSPRSIANSSTHLRHSSYDQSNPTQSNGLPTIGGGQSYNPRPVGHDRDRSQSRDDREQNNNSGPTVNLDTRFLDEDNQAAKKKQDRERLFRIGFGKNKEERT